MAQVYEASDRVGGRCWTLRGAFADGQIAEHGGELIDQGHNAIRQLAQELGLTLDNLLRAEANGTEMFYYFDGEPYIVRRDHRRHQADLAADSRGRLGRELSDALQQLHAAGLRARPDVDRRLDRRSSPAGRARGWASCSTSPTTSSTAPRHPSRARSTSSTCSATRGRASSASSASRTRSTTCAAATTRSRRGSPPRWRARSRPGRSSSRSRQTSGGGYTLTFDWLAAGRRGGRRPRRARAAVLDPAAPRSTTRRQASRPRKLTAIQELGMGTNSKLHVQFRTATGTALG